MSQVITGNTKKKIGIAIKYYVKAKAIPKPYFILMEIVTSISHLMKIVRKLMIIFKYYPQLQHC